MIAICFEENESCHNDLKEYQKADEKDPTWIYYTGVLIIGIAAGLTISDLSNR